MKTFDMPLLKTKDLGSAYAPICESRASAFQLRAGETRTLLFAGSEPEVGWVQVTASKPVTAHARIVAKAIGESKIICEMTYLP